MITLGFRSAVKILAELNLALLDKNEPRWMMLMQEYVQHMTLNEFSPDRHRTYVRALVACMPELEIMNDPRGYEYGIYVYRPQFYWSPRPLAAVVDFWTFGPPAFRAYTIGFESKAHFWRWLSDTFGGEYTVPVFGAPDPR
jgi:hypothetical protein